MNRKLRLAFWLSFTPLVLGLSTYGLWLATDWSWLMVLGVLVIWGGCGATVIAAVLLGLGWWQASRDAVGGEAAARVRPGWSAAGIALLLLCNFPVAYVVFHLAIARITRFEVVLCNEAASSWPELILEGGGIREVVAALPPGATTRVELWFRTDGELVLRSAAEPATLATVVSGYVTNGMGGSLRVARRADGQLQVHEQWGR